VNAVLTCTASALQKDANAADLQQYVDGKITIDKVKAKSQAAGDAITDDIENCAKQAVGAG
jgi:hypothetical protein